MPVTFEFNFEKASAAIVYLASKPEEVPEFDKLKAAKLLFLADKCHLVRYGRPIIGDRYKGLAYGPIPQTVMDFLHAVIDPEKKGQYVDASKARKLADALNVDRGYKYPRLSAKEPINFSEVLSKSDLSVLDHIVAVHGKKSAIELSALTHVMPTYAKAWNSRGDDKTVDLAYEDFFDEDPDAIEGAFEEMLENDGLKKALCAR